MKRNDNDGDMKGGGMRTKEGRDAEDKRKSGDGYRLE